MRCVFWLSAGVRELATMLALMVVLEPKLKRKQLSEQQRAAGNNRSHQHEAQTAHASCIWIESPPRVSGFFLEDISFHQILKAHLTLKVGVTVVAMSALSNLCRRILNNKGKFFGK